jgi:hypothetical protein
VLVSAAGDNYSAGNDLQDFLDHPPGNGDSPQKQMIDVLRVLDKPLVGAVRGAAVGSGATSHSVARLRLAIVAMRYGQNDLVQVSEATLPSPDELPMRYAVATIHALQWSNQATLAVDYAYRVLRANNSELEAHKAYLASLAPGTRPDIQATMDTVESGSAVQYSEGKRAQSVGSFSKKQQCLATSLKSYRCRAKSRKNS